VLNDKEIIKEEIPEVFPCKVCQCEFPTEEYCRIHEEQHDKLKEEKLMRVKVKKEYVRNPILCHICGKYFAKNRSEMSVHLRRHRGEKPYKCEFCEKSFAAGSGLRSVKNQKKNAHFVIFNIFFNLHSGPIGESTQVRNRILANIVANCMVITRQELNMKGKRIKFILSTKKT
jgi:hypothetical protein